MSVAFIKEESAETASETLLPDRPISPHPNLVTETGLKALELHLQQAREAFDATSTIEDVNERRRQSAGPLRELRYFAERVRTAQLVPDPASFDVVAFGSTVTFSRDDGRVQKYRIVGEDEADPKAGSISYVSPVARVLMGKSVGDVASVGDQELEILAIHKAPMSPAYGRDAYTRASAPAYRRAYVSRSTFFWTLPIVLRGRSSTKITRFGCL